MSNRKLLKGVVLGAIAGGALAMLDQSTRNEVMGKVKETCTNTKYIVKHPSEAIHKLRTSYDTFANELSGGVNTTLNVLEKIQEFLDSLEVDEKK
ncbi:YtxH domain-containing protein [Aquibacillus albus]|uniref:Gas vesicle protein n=1 Tax=Aquibacillus albus TaxID=1168171 RepID=A0ABS2N2T6_9BACI|nr:YtxH domain-containing protein [Aquibacillus albus]MBM7572417.1 gas vesicle protein [Aquibacillus albus]